MISFLVYFLGGLTLFLATALEDTGAGLEAVLLLTTTDLEREGATTGVIFLAVLTILASALRSAFWSRFLAGAFTTLATLLLLERGGEAFFSSFLGAGLVFYTVTLL